MTLLIEFTVGTAHLYSDFDQILKKSPHWQRQKLRAQGFETKSDFIRTYTDKFIQWLYSKSR